MKQLCTLHDAVPDKGGYMKQLCTLHDAVPDKGGYMEQPKLNKTMDTYTTPIRYTANKRTTRIQGHHFLN